VLVPVTPVPDSEGEQPLWDQLNTLASEISALLTLDADQKQRAKTWVEIASL